MSTATSTPPVDARVAFAEGTPQWKANAGIVYVVTPSPSGEPFSVDEHGRPYLWLTDERDLTRAPSRRRRRTGWVDALEVQS